MNGKQNATDFAQALEWDLAPFARMPARDSVTKTALQLGAVNRVLAFGYLARGAQIENDEIEMIAFHGDEPIITKAMDLELQGARWRAGALYRSIGFGVIFGAVFNIQWALLQFWGPQTLAALLIGIPAIFVAWRTMVVGPRTASLVKGHLAQSAKVTSMAGVAWALSQTRLYVTDPDRSEGFASVRLLADLPPIEVLEETGIPEIGVRAGMLDARLYAPVFFDGRLDKVEFQDAIDFIRARISVRA